MHSRTDVMYCIVNVNVNVNVNVQHDRSALHVAAERGHTRAVEQLVDKYGADVLARTADGSTLLHVASVHGHPETTLAFLRRGVPLAMPNKAGELCLHAAAARGHAGVVRALLERAQTVDARTKHAYTALHLAVENVRPEV